MGKQMNSHILARFLKHVQKRNGWSITGKQTNKKSTTVLEKQHFQHSLEPHLSKIEWDKGSSFSNNVFVCILQNFSPKSLKSKTGYNIPRAEK
jgi:hypothetical protein